VKNMLYIEMLKNVKRDERTKEGNAILYGQSSKYVKERSPLVDLPLVEVLIVTDIIEALMFLTTQRF